VEGAPACFFRGLFILCADVGISHRQAGVGHGLLETLAVLLLGLAPLDPGHIGGLHEGLPAVHATVGHISHLAAQLPKRWIQ